MNFENVLKACAEYAVSFVVVGSHALYLLNKELDLGIDINLLKKDLDLVVRPDRNFLNFVRAAGVENTLIDSRNLTLYKIVGQENTDLIVQMKFRRMVIDNEVISGVSYASLQRHCQSGILYNHNVKYVDIAAYYGIIKNTGLTKYLEIRQKILAKHPELNDRVQA